MKTNFNCKNKHSKGPSSFFMHNPEVVFKELDIKDGNTFLDIGCGAGDYSFYASEFVGESGMVYAIDKYEQVINSINSKKTGNIKAKTADITESLPIEDNSVDICLLSTVLHSIDLNMYGEKIFSEINRILKPNGYVFVIECKKEDILFGPPLNMRLSEEELENKMKQYDFTKVSLTDLGYNYMIKFKVE